MWIAIFILAGFIVLELAEGKIRGNYWRVWLTREENLAAYWTIIAAQAACIAVILWIRFV